MGQLFKANSKIALEPEVLEVFCLCFLFEEFCQGHWERWGRPCVARRLLGAQELGGWKVQPHTTLACESCNFLFKKQVGMFLKRDNNLKVAERFHKGILCYFASIACNTKRSISQIISPSCPPLLHNEI